MKKFTKITSILLVMIMCIMVFPVYASEPTVTIEDIENLKKEIEQTESEYTKVLEQYNKGSVGFFDYVGADSAKQIISNRISNQQNDTYWWHTNLGSEKDATNLSNFEASIFGMYLLGEYRYQLFNTYYNTSYEAFAVAQVLANALNTKRYDIPISEVIPNVYEVLGTTDVQVVITFMDSKTDSPQLAHPSSGYPNLNPQYAINIENCPLTYTEYQSVCGFVATEKYNSTAIAWSGEKRFDGKMLVVQLFFNGDSTKTVDDETIWNQMSTYYQPIYGKKLALGDKLKTLNEQLQQLLDNYEPVVSDMGKVSAKSSGNNILLSWDKVENAEGYLIYGKHGAKDPYGYIGITSNTSFVDMKANREEYNFYWVYPYVKNSSGKMFTGKCPKYVYAKPGEKLPAVTNFLSNSTKSGAKLWWDSVQGAEGYLIYGIVDGKPYKYVGMTKNTTFTDTKASTEKWNYYWVYPYFTKDGTMIPGSAPSYKYAKKLK